MSFLLDTNILSEHLRRPSGLTHRFVQHSGRLFTSAVSLAELYTWAYRRPDPAPALAAIGTMLRAEVGVIPFGADCADQFGRLRTDLLRGGTVVNPMDLLIASTALVFGLTPVTHNTRHFENIPGLALDDWLAP